MQYLSAVCRIGGERFSSHAKKNKHEAHEYSVGIQHVFECDVTKDEAHIHPRYICSPCHQVILRNEEKGYRHCGGGCAGKLVAWVAHAEPDCTFCKNMKSSSKGGRKPKKKKIAYIQ